MYEHGENAVDENGLTLYQFTHNTKPLMGEGGVAVRAIKATKESDDCVYIECAQKAELNPEIENGFSIFPMGEDGGLFAYLLINRDNMRRLECPDENMFGEVFIRVTNGHFGCKRILDGVVIERCFTDEDVVSNHFFKEGEYLFTVITGDSSAIVSPINDSTLRRSVFVGKNRVSWLIIK